MKNKKLFLNFLFDFWNLHQILKILKEKMIVAANEFPKLQTVKNVVRALPKKRPSWTRFHTQHVKASQILANFHESAFIMFFIILVEFDL